MPSDLNDVLRTLARLRTELDENPSDWENPTLESYLEAMQAWLEDMNSKRTLAPTWELIVDILEAAKIYE